MKQAIARNPMYRRAFIGILILLYLGLCVYFPLWYWGTWTRDRLIPMWAISLFRAVMMGGFLVGVPSFYLMLRAYLDGWHLLAEWGQRYRKLIRLANILAYTGIATMFIAGMWVLIAATR